MGLVQDSTGYYLDNASGQYYSPYAPRPMTTNYLGFPQQFSTPQGLISQGGNRYRPFTGNALGINEGKRSMVYQLMQNQQPYEYNAPSLQSLFGNMQAPQGMQNMQGNPFQGGYGAGRFAGGLLGGMPTPVSSETTQAPSTSGAGRFL
jgi:hypothetical protein